MKKTTNFVLKKPRLVIMILLLITAFFLYQIHDKARIETNMDNYMPKDHPAFENSDYYEDLFNIEDAIIVAIAHEDDIFNYASLSKIEKITDSLAELEAVNSNQVDSIISARNIEGSDFGLEIGPFIDHLEDDEEQIEKLKNDVLANEMIHGRMVSEDNRVALIAAELSETEVDRVELYYQVKEITEDLSGPEEIYIAGQPVVEGTLARLMPEDMAVMVPLVVLVIVIALLIIFKSIKSTILTLLVVLFSTIWAFGLKSLLNIPIYVVSTMIPVMLIALGVADGIHLLSHLQLKLKQEKMSLNHAIKDMIKNLWKPVVMTSVTTSVGFISLLTSEVYAVKYFGLFTAFGVIAAMIFSLLFIPAALKVFKLPRVKLEEEVANKKNSNNSFEKFALKTIASKKLIIIVSIMLFISGIVGLQRVETESSFLSRFEEDEEIAIADSFINQNFAGTTSLNVIFSGEEDDFKNPVYLQEIWELQQELESHVEVGDSFALTDYLRRINKVMNDNQKEYNTLPDSKELTAQYLLLYSMSGNREDLDSVVDYDYKRTNLRINLKSDSAVVIKEVMDKIETFIASKNIATLEVDYAGSAYTNMVFADLITAGQIRSLILSLFIIFILLALLFKSLKAGVLGALPIMIAAIINFGIMGYLGISLNVTTALVSSIAVGMGIDYSIHLLAKYQKNGQEEISSLQAAKNTMNQAGRAIVFNAVVVIIGFLVLTFSNFTTNRELGWLVSLSLFNSFVLTLTLVVVLIDKYKPEFIFKKKD